jgi:hypothetical protein
LNTAEMGSVSPARNDGVVDMMDVTGKEDTRLDVGNARSSYVVLQKISPVAWWYDETLMLTYSWILLPL